MTYLFAVGLTALVGGLIVAHILLTTVFPARNAEEVVGGLAASAFVFAMSLFLMAVNLERSPEADRVFTELTENHRSVD